MGTPKNAPYKQRQRDFEADAEGRLLPSVGRRSFRLASRSGAATDAERSEMLRSLNADRKRMPRGEAFRVRGGREYVVDPETGQWWRAEKWRARNGGKR